MFPKFRPPDEFHTIFVVFLIFSEKESSPLVEIVHV